MSVTNFRRVAAVPVAIGFLLRVTYLLRWRRKVELTGDPYFYYHQAKLLVEGRGFIHPFTLVAEQRVEQAADHPPLFPLFLACLNKVGITSVTQQTLLNCVIGTISIILVMVIARRISGDRYRATASVWHEGEWATAIADRRLCGADAACRWRGQRDARFFSRPRHSEH